MNKIQKKLSWCAFVTYMSVPSFVSATPWDYSDEPLWLSTAVQHNLMLALDDSGSMDFEVLFSNNDGAIYLNANGFFADSDGDLYSGGSKYVYLFPNGQSGSYEGRRINDNHYAIPPIPAYAFARSHEYNVAYYDPAVTYLPWPDYSEYSSQAGKDTFTDAPVGVTPWEPVSSLNFDDGAGESGLALFAEHDTADFAVDQWAFDIRDGDMVCEDDGSTCSTGQKDYAYYPATYYLKDTSSTIYYNTGLDTSTYKSTLIEAENDAGGNSYSDPFRDAVSLDAAVSLNVGKYGAGGTEIDEERADIADAKAEAVGGDFIGTPTKALNNNAGSTVFSAGEGAATYTFDTDAGTVNIWMRVYTRSGSNDSFFVKLDGYNALSVGSTLTMGPDSDNLWPADGGLEWNQFWQALTTEDKQWEWKLWATADVAAATQTLQIRRREGGTYLDQILITEDLTYVPESGLESLSARPIRCADETTAAMYREFVQHPERFQKTSTISSDPNNWIDGLAFDGACLKKYQVAMTGVDDSAEADNGVTGEDDGAERSNAEERQNFANWFMYYRKRHQAMRGGLASAMQGINGIKTGLFWINRRRGVEAGDMFDMDTSEGIANFLNDHFETVRSGGTPLRLALEHARDQLSAEGGPVTSECQKNYTLLFTDGFSTTDIPASFTQYTEQRDASGNIVRDADGDPILVVSGYDNDDGAGEEPYADSYSGTLADIAYRGYNELLRPSTAFATGNVKVDGSCADGTATAWEDCNTNLHMNTYTVGMGANGTIYGVTHTTTEDAYTNPPVWPNVNASRDARQIDDLYHAAVNGRGEMYNASSPQELGSELGRALDSITESIGSGSGVTFNSSSLQAQDGAAIFTTIFNSSNWTGDVGGLALDSSGNVGELIWEDSSGNPASAATILNERDLSTDPRVILTYDRETTTDGVAFQWAQLSDTHKEDLRTNPSGFTVRDTTDATPDADGIARLNILRGNIVKDMSIQTVNGGVNKTINFRDRWNGAAGLPMRMGDIIHSAPVYVGQPASIWPDADPFGGNADDGSQRYSFFKNRTITEGGVADRDPTIYVGTNGGMLHGFNASVTDSEGGREVLAYIPNALFSSTVDDGLHYLTDPEYQHRYYVDLTPVAQDVYTAQEDGGTKAWRTMLVGGLRGGGKGLFALDVSNPDDFSESGTAPADTVMWEFTDEDDTSGDLGYQITPPTVAMMNNDQWAVIFGNGLDSINGTAKVYILFVEQGLDGTWTASSDFIKLDTETGNTTNKNGITGVTLADTNGDYVVDRIYGSDLYGNIWVFDVTNSSSNRWETAYKQGGNPEPLFTASYTNSGGDTFAQPITGAPNIALNIEQVTGGNEPNILVSFGTGQYLSSGDERDDSVQSFYTVWDSGTSGLTRSSLEVRELVDNADNNREVADTANDINWSTQYGWYFDLQARPIDDTSASPTAEGERVINRPLIANDVDVGPVAIFASVIPSESECAGGGSSILYAVPLLTGTNPEKAIIDLDGDGTYEEGVGFRQDTLLNDPNRLGDILYGSKSESEGLDESNVSKVDANLDLDSSRTGRLGWNELVSD